MNEMFEWYCCEYAQKHGTTEGAYEYASKKCEDDYRRNDRIIGWTIIGFATLAFVGLALLPFLKAIGVIS